jgi:molybdopterin-binding protein
LDDVSRKILKLKGKPFPELEYEKGGYTLELDSALKIVNGDLAYEVDVTIAEGATIKNFYSQKTGLKVKQVVDGPVSSVSEWSNYEGINGGIKIPFLTRTTLVGQSIEFKVKETAVNNNISAELFR